MDFNGVFVVNYDIPASNCFSATISYHGKPCVKCGGTERYTRNSNCRACSKSNSRRTQKNLKKSKEHSEYLEKSPEKFARYRGVSGKISDVIFVVDGNKVLRSSSCEKCGCSLVNPYSRSCSCCSRKTKKKLIIGASKEIQKLFNDETVSSELLDQAEKDMF